MMRLPKTILVELPTFLDRKVGPNVRNRRRERRLEPLEIVHVQIKPEGRFVFPISKNWKFDDDICMKHVQSK